MLYFLYLLQILERETDENHAITTKDIINRLEEYGVTAERKSIYSDLADMTDKLGIEIIKEKVGKETYYHVGSRDFEVAELKLLVDAIQSSKFITEKKSRELIKKLEGQASMYEAKWTTL